MKRIHNIISFLVILLLFSSCYDDESSLASGKIAEIQVTSNVKDTINIPTRGMISRGSGVSVNTRRMLLIKRLQQLLKRSVQRLIWSTKRRKWDIIFFAW